LGPAVYARRVSQPPRLTADLLALFPARDDAARSLSVPLPPGRTVRGDEGDDDNPALWVSDGPVAAGLWRSLHAEQRHSGLCPLLLDTLPGDARRPWDDGELWPADMSSPDGHDAAELLAGWWASHTETDEEDDALSPAERLEVTAPYGRQWPGLAERRRAPVDPDEHAGRCVEELLRASPGLRLGLVAADRGSDALTTAGWQGAVNYTNDTAELSAVLRSWEDRFGVRVIGVGFAELHLSVAAPPRDQAEALRVAAEHFAFCPDNVWQGVSPLVAYAEHLVDAPLWQFWWD
jgi:hypothetical protein